MIERRVSRRQAFGLLASAAALGWAGRPLTSGPLTPGASPGSQGGQGQPAAGGPPLPDSLLGRLMDPAAGGMRSPVTAYENDPVVVGIEQKIRCTCGCNLSVYTCRTTDFTCAVSPAMHQHVVELLKQGESAQQILDAFVGQYGESVLMAPPREGFNLLGYLLPGSLILVAGTALTWVLLRRTGGRVGGRSAPAADLEPSAAEGSVPTDRPRARPLTLPPDDAARLRAELEQLEP